jgi:hypothetical protein
MDVKLRYALARGLGEVLTRQELVEALEEAVELLKLVADEPMGGSSVYTRIREALGQVE